MHSVVARGLNNREKSRKGLETQGEHSGEFCKDERSARLMRDVVPVEPQCFLSAKKSKPQSFQREANLLEAFGICKGGVTRRSKTVAVEETFLRQQISHNY